MRGRSRKLGSEREGSETETIATLRPKFFDNSGDIALVRLWEPFAELNQLQSNKIRSTTPYDMRDDPTENVRRSQEVTQSPEN